MKSLVLLVGVPGSGKTTLAKQLEQRGYFRLCADDIRNELFGSERDTRDPKQADQVFAEFFRRLESYLQAGNDVVIDNTNINTRHRGPIIQRGIKAGYQDIQLWIMDIPLETCIERNKVRDRQIPDDVLRNYFNTLNGKGRPSRHEGKLILVRPSEQPMQFRFFPIEKSAQHPQP